MATMTRTPRQGARYPRAYRPAGGGGGRGGGEGDPGEYSPSYDEAADAARSEYEVVPDWMYNQWTTAPMAYDQWSSGQTRYDWPTDQLGAPPANYVPLTAPEGGYWPGATTTPAPAPWTPGGLTTAATAPVGGTVAADGQTLAGQSPDIQATFLATYGPAVAPVQWVAEHNAAIGQAQAPPPTAPGVPPVAGAPPSAAPPQPGAVPPIPPAVQQPTPLTAGSTTLRPGDVTPFGVIRGEGDIGLPLGLGSVWHQMLLGEIARRTDATGRLQTMGPNGEIVDSGQQTLAAAWQEAQRKFAEAALTGTIDGQPTMAAQQLKQQAEQFAQTMGLNRDQLAAQISQFAQQFGLQQGALTGTYNGAPTEAARQFNESLGFQQQQALAQATADPNRIVESANLGRLFGAARGGLPGGNTGINALPAAYTGAGTGTGTSGASAQFGLAPELVQYLRGETPPQFGSPTSVPTGQMTSIEQLRQSGFNARQTPQAYRNLSATGRAELGATNLAVTGQRPQDLQSDIFQQLPQQQSRVPSSYRF